ncbi:MAG: hypothetical protein U0894_05810 [Pirellulales bacterium]
MKWRFTGWRLMDCAVVFFVISALVSGPLCFGSFRNTGKFLSGHTLLFDEVVNAGQAKEGEFYVTTLRVVNGGTKPVKILGCHSSAMTIPTSDFPLKLNPLEAGELRLRWRQQVPQGLGFITSKDKVRFFTDCKSEPFFEVEFVTKVLASRDRLADAN